MKVKTITKDEQRILHLALGETEGIIRRALIWFIINSEVEE